MRGRKTAVGPGDLPWRARQTQRTKSKQHTNQGCSITVCFWEGKERSVYEPSPPVCTDGLQQHQKLINQRTGKQENRGFLLYHSVASPVSVTCSQTCREPFNYKHYKRFSFSKRRAVVMEKSCLLWLCPTRGLSDTSSIFPCCTGCLLSISCLRRQISWQGVTVYGSSSSPSPWLALESPRRHIAESIYEVFPAKFSRTWKIRPKREWCHPIDWG